MKKLPPYYELKYFAALCDDLMDNGIIASFDYFNGRVTVCVTRDRNNLEQVGALVMNEWAYTKLEMLDVLDLMLFYALDETSWQIQENAA